MWMMIRHCDCEEVFFNNFVGGRGGWAAGDAIFHLIRQWESARPPAQLTLRLPLLLHRIHQLRLVVSVTITYN
jgi:hypothetical protein